MHNISHLIHKNTPCRRFWDGFFNFSEKKCFIKSIQGKEIQVVEIHDPRVKSSNALKIALLFTVIVPLIAAIHYFIKDCHFRSYHVTLLRPQDMRKVEQRAQAQFRKIEEHEISLTRLPDASLRIIQPTEEEATITLDPTVAFELIKKGPLNKETEEKLLAILKDNPHSAEKIFDRLYNALNKKDNKDFSFYDTLFISYFSHESFLKEPNSSVKLINNPYFRYSLDNALGNNQFIKTFEEKIRALLSHKEILPQNQIKLIFNFCDYSPLSTYFLDILNAPTNFEKLQTAFLDPNFNQKVYEGLNREWTFYIDLIGIFQLSNTFYEKTSILLKARPNDFDITKVNHFDVNLVFAVEALYHSYQKRTINIEEEFIGKLDKSQIGQTLAKITPAPQFENILQLLSQYGITRYISSWILHERNDADISEFLKVVLEKFRTYFIDISSIENFFLTIYTAHRLNLALDVIVNLPQKIKDAFLHAFSGGIYSPPLTIKIYLSGDQIDAVYNHRQLEIKETPLNFDDFHRGVNNV